MVHRGNIGNFAEQWRDQTIQRAELDEILRTPESNIWWRPRGAPLQREGATWLYVPGKEFPTTRRVPDDGRSVHDRHRARENEFCKITTALPLFILPSSQPSHPFHPSVPIFSRAFLYAERDLSSLVLVNGFRARGCR